MIRLILIVLITIFISSFAVWVANKEGKVIIEWLGWQINTSPGFFLITIFTLSYSVYIILAFLGEVLKMPGKIRNRVKNKRIKKAEIYLQKGIIAAFYGNKEETFKSLDYTKKFLKNSPLMMLLEFQNHVFNKNDKESFLILSQMIDIPILKPLAIKGLIAYSRKKKDLDLFKNVLNKSLDKEIKLSWIKQDLYNFCARHNADRINILCLVRNSYPNDG